MNNSIAMIAILEKRCGVSLELDCAQITLTSSSADEASNKAVVNKARSATQTFNLTHLIKPQELLVQLIDRAQVDEMNIPTMAQTLRRTGVSAAFGSAAGGDGSAYRAKRDDPRLSQESSSPISVTSFPAKLTSLPSTIRAHRTVVFMGWRKKKPQLLQPFFVSRSFQSCNISLASTRNWTSFHK